jgi:hypothetical protein
VDEIYRMLGRERQADLDREALKWRRAAAFRRGPRSRRVLPLIAYVASRANEVCRSIDSFKLLNARGQAMEAPGSNPGYPD